MKLYQIKLREFQNGVHAVSEDERKFIEIETLLANHQAGNIFARLKEVNDRLTQKKKSTTIDAA